MKVLRVFNILIILFVFSFVMVAPTSVDTAATSEENSRDEKINKINSKVETIQTDIDSLKDSYKKRSKMINDLLKHVNKKNDAR
jgi:peptidoglycan hydrolase CwlO-like protein